MKLTTLMMTTAAVAFLGGAASAQQPQPAPAPTPGSVTGDWNGAHAPSDDKQYQKKEAVPVAVTPAPATEASAALPPVPETPAVSATSSLDTAPAATSASSNVSANAASFTNVTVTNGPVPDTKENRAKYGQPLSRAGRMTSARGN